jgi:hypothetical protein
MQSYLAYSRFCMASEQRKMTERYTSKHSSISCLANVLMKGGGGVMGDILKLSLE